MNSYQLTSDQTNQPTKWQARIEKRRSEGENVVPYVDRIIQDKHVSLKQVTAFLTPEELQEMERLAAQRAKEKAGLEARMEAQRIEDEREFEESVRLRATFWESNPPSPFTAVPDIKTESELFDALARYHIVKVEYSFYAVDYHWDEFLRIEQPDIEAWLCSGEELDLRSEEALGLPEDDDGSIGYVIYEAIEELASKRAEVATDEGKLQEGTVTFDVPNRRITLEAVVEVTRKEDFELTWSPDET